MKPYPTQSHAVALNIITDVEEFHKVCYGPADANKK